MNLLYKIRPYALGAAVTVLLDRLIDVEMLDTTALAVIVAYVVIEGGVYLGRRIYS